MDLAEVHFAALNYLSERASARTILLTVNLGTGRGYSVVDMVLRPSSRQAATPFDTMLSCAVQVIGDD